MINYRTYFIRFNKYLRIFINSSLTTSALLRVFTGTRTIIIAFSWKYCNDVLKDEMLIKILGVLISFSRIEFSKKSVEVLNECDSSLYFP